jgi:tellurite resistance protein
MNVPTLELSDSQATVLARGLASVARADGSVDPRELHLIRALVEDPKQELADVAPDEVKGAFADGEAARLFLRSCLLVALADAEYSAAERALVQRYAEALGVAEKELDSLAQSVKEYLLQPLARLANTDAVVELSRKLQV